MIHSQACLWVTTSAAWESKGDTEDTTLFSPSLLMMYPQP